jgi:hypothetical protein
MAKSDSTYIPTISTTGSKLHTDSSPINQPKGTHRFALNAVVESEDGDHNFITNERANFLCTVINQGFFPIGEEYFGEDASLVISVNSITGVENIGVIDRDNIYRTIVETKTLGLKITNQCDVRYQT